VTRYFSIALAISIGLLSCTSARGLELQVEATAVATGGRQLLEISITNASLSEAEIPSRNLPWVDGESLLIAAAKWKEDGDWWSLEPGSTNAKQATEGNATVGPGENVRGFVELSSRIQNLDEALKTHDVVVFWFWRRDQRTAEGGGYGGFVVIPRGGAVAHRENSAGMDARHATLDVPVEVDAEPAIEDGRDALRFEIANRTTTTLTIAREFLPWIFPPTLVVAAVGLHPPRVLKTAHPLIGLPYGEVTLGAGQRLEGVLRLDQRLVNIDHELSRSEVVVFWLYGGKATDGRRLGRHGGFEVLPKGGLPSN
jgi:hypothetical protein